MHRALIKVFLCSRFGSILAAVTEVLHSKPAILFPVVKCIVLEFMDGWKSFKSLTCTSLFPTADMESF